MKTLGEPTLKVELGVSLKTCCRCKEEKSLCLFSNLSSTKDGKSKRCKECDKHYHNNRSEETKRLAKERRQSGRYSSREADWREANKDYLRDYHKTWSKLNQHKKNANSSKRHAAKLNATPSWLTNNHLMEIESFYAHAKDCQVISDGEYHVDHIVPLLGKNVCGLHVPWNLQVLPADVNMRKNNRYEDSW